MKEKKTRNDFKTVCSSLNTAKSIPQCVKFIIQANIEAKELELYDYITM